jgi:hypothetical protein
MLSLDERTRPEERKHHTLPILLVAMVDRISQIG